MALALMVAIVVTVTALIVAESRRGLPARPPRRRRTLTAHVPPRAPDGPPEPAEERCHDHSLHPTVPVTVQTTYGGDPETVAHLCPVCTLPVDERAVIYRARVAGWIALDPVAAAQRGNPDDTASDLAQAAATLRNLAARPAEHDHGPAEIARLLAHADELDAASRTAMGRRTLRSPKPSPYDAETRRRNAPDLGLIAHTIQAGTITASRITIGPTDPGPTSPADRTREDLTRALAAASKHAQRLALDMGLQVTDGGTLTVDRATHDAYTAAVAEANSIRAALEKHHERETETVTIRNGAGNILRRDIVRHHFTY